MPVFVDAHVHLQDCFRIEPFLDGALRNLEAALDPPGYLLLADMVGQDTFGRIRGEESLGDWTLEETAEEETLIAHKGGRPALILVSGRQIACREGIEWLALGTRQRFGDGRALVESLREIREAGALPVLPWGFGKWWFSRSAIVKQLIEDESRSPACDRILLGDNGLRTALLGRPSAFTAARRAGMSILPGTDPLPFPSHEGRAGSYAFAIDCPIDLSAPWRVLRDALTTGCELRTLGRLQSPLRFVGQQVAMQLRKRG